MSERLRLTVGIVLVVGIVALASQGIPSIPAVARMIEALDWLSGSDITQLVFLTASLALMLALSRGRGSLYGLRWVGRRELWGVFRASVWVPIVVGVVSFLGALASGQAGGGPPGMGPTGWGFAKLVVSVWIVASVSEEMLFRGLFQGFLSPLRRRGFSVRGVRLSLPVTLGAVGFGLIHLGLLRVAPPPMVALVVPTATILGFIAGYFREKTGSIVPAIVAHFVFNVVGAGIPMLGMLVMSR